MIFPLIAVLQQAPADSGRHYRGREHELAVDIPRFDSVTAVIDGRLDEAVWQHAAVLTGFSQYQPVDSRPAEEPTEIRVWYGPNAIYFGIRAREVHGDVVRATHADRDNIGADDNVQILLDTYDDHRRAFLFGVNPFGIQQDGIRSEAFSGGAGGFSAGGRTFAGNILDGNVDLNPDFIWESRGRLLPDSSGYEVEIRIPFKSLRYQGAAVQNWGINVLRRSQHSGYQDSWAPVVRASASFLTQSGSLVGLHDLQRGLVMELTPVATGHADGTPDSTGRWHYASGADAGLDARWGITPNLSLDGTINPDFSQVEADVGQVTINERFALFFPEKRPFFLEGLELFDTPNQLIYTRRIVDPDWGIKLAGKAANNDIGLLAAADNPAQSGTGSTPLYGTMRLRHDLGASSTAGLVMTTREDGPDYSRLLGADAHIVHSKLYYIGLQAVQSWSADSSGHVSGPLWEGVWDRTGRGWGFHYRLTGVAPDFNAAAGFVNRTGVTQLSIFNRLTGYGKRGAFVETETAFIGYDRTFDYTHFGSQAAIEGDEQVQGSIQLHGGWNVAPAIADAFVSYTAGNYGNYTVQRTQGATTDTIPFTVPGTLDGLASWSLRVTTPTYRQFTAQASVGRSRVAIFEEAAPGSQASYSASVDWRPTTQLRVSGQWQRRVLNRRDSGARFSNQDIPRIKIEYQATRAIFFRFVGQYTATRTAALVDAQNQPILINDTLQAAASSNDLRVDWLFSYRPSPGTLIYLGYGSSLDEPSAFAFSKLSRTQDGFFAKVSYLLHL